MADSIVVPIELRVTGGEQAARDMGRVAPSSETGRVRAPSPRPAETARAAARQTEATAELSKNIRTLAAGYLTNTGISTVTSVIGSQEGGTRTANRIGSVSGGALGGAMAGSVFGPVGAGIGAAVGAAASAISAFAEEAKKARDTLFGISQAKEAPERQHRNQFMDAAFARSLEGLSRKEQIREIRGRIDAFSENYGTHGTDKPIQYTLPDIKAALAYMADEGKEDTPQFQKLKTIYSENINRTLALRSMLENLQRAPVTGFIDPAAVGDSLAAMGGSVGEQVSAQAVNEKIFDVLKKIYELDRRRGTEDPTKPWFYETRDTSKTAVWQS